MGMDIEEFKKLIEEDIDKAFDVLDDEIFSYADHKEGLDDFQEQIKDNLSEVFEIPKEELFGSVPNVHSISGLVEKSQEQIKCDIEICQENHLRQIGVVDRVEEQEDGTQKVWMTWTGTGISGFHIPNAPISISVQDVDRWRHHLPPSYKFEREKTYAERMDERFPHWCFNPECNDWEPIMYEHALNQYLKKNRLELQYFLVNKNTSLNSTHGLFMLAKHKRELIKQFKAWWRDERVQFYCCECFKEVEF